MSIYDFSYIDVDNLEVQVSLVIKDTLDRRTSVLVNPNLDTSTEFEGCRFSQKYKDLCTLMILLHFSDAFGDLREYVGIEVQEYLEKRLLFPELNACLFQKEIVIPAILGYSKFNHTRAIFGQLLTKEQILRVLSQVRLKKIYYRRPRKIAFKRGYKDKGSLRPESTWLPKSDWSFDDIQRQAEERRVEYQATVHSIRNECLSWVLRSSYDFERRDTNE